MWLALHFSYHGLSGVQLMFRLTFSLTLLKYTFYLNRICLLLLAITIGKGKIIFLNSAEKFIKRRQNLLEGIRRKADSFYSHSQR